MSYLVSEILEDVILRMNQANFGNAGGEVFVLRKMNQAYKRLNMEYAPCRKAVTADWSTYTAETLEDYIALPDDWIKGYSMNPFREFRMPSVWKNDEDLTYTIDSSSGTKRIYIAGATITTSIAFKYYSSGLQLVNSASPAAGTEANEPEWPEELKQLIYFETLMSLNVGLDDYEISQRNVLIGRMSGMRVQEYLQATGPNVGGEIAKGGRLSIISDPYSRTS